MNLVQRIVVGLLALFPCALSGVLGLVALCVGWEWAWPGHTSQYYLWPPVKFVVEAFIACDIVVISLIVTLVIIRKLFILSPRRAFWFGMGIVLFFLFLRWLLLIVFINEAVPFSDFLWAWQRASGLSIDELGLNHRWWPVWMNYALFLKGAMNVFGGEYWKCILTGMSFDMFTMAGIYLFLKTLNTSLEFRFLGVLIYVVNPSSCIYGLTPSPEHMAMACFIWAMVVFINALHERPILQIFFLTLGGGCLAGIGESVKPLLLIFCCALFLGLIASSVKSKGRVVLQVVLFVIVAKATAFAVTQVSARTFDVELRESTAYPYYLNVGLNRQGEGQIHVGKLSRRYIADLNRGVPLGQARANIVTRLKEDWHGHVSEIPSFIIRKMIWAWQDDLTPFRYFSLSVKERKNWTRGKCVWNKFICDHIPSVAQVWYIATMFALAGLMVLSVFREECFCYGEVVLVLICLGFFALVLVGEAQSRYKCLILPCLCMLLAKQLESALGRRVNQ